MEDKTRPAVSSSATTASSSGSSTAASALTSMKEESISEEAKKLDIMSCVRNDKETNDPSKTVKDEATGGLSEAAATVKVKEGVALSSGEKRSRDASEEDQTNEESAKKKTKREETGNSSSNLGNLGLLKNRTEIWCEIVLIDIKSTYFKRFCFFSFSTSCLLCLLPNVSFHYCTDYVLASSSMSSATGTTAVSATSVKPSRGTRGSLSEKAEKGGKTSKRSVTGGVGGTDKKSPPSSATNSPKKPASRDQSDEEDPSNETGRKSAELKVPPLKIVLSGQSGSNGSGNVVEDKKSPLGKEDSSKEATVEKQGLSFHVLMT